jgi:AbrB family looped-hinge helix DNA binding protein
MRVTSKGQVTIPKKIRDRLGIVAGEEVEFVARGPHVIVQKRVDPGADFAFDAWADRVADMIDTDGLDGRNYVDWLRGGRDDVDPR